MDTAVIGRVAFSKAGRDEGKMLIVVGLLNEDFVLVADGDLRPVERPKKKRLKHLRFTEHTTGAIAEKLNNGIRILNSDIREAIREVRELL